MKEDGTLQRTATLEEGTPSAASSLSPGGRPPTGEVHLRARFRETICPDDRKTGPEGSQVKVQVLHANSS